MHLRYMKFFIAVAETKSFTQAAQKMNTAQPSLSRQIKKLEEIVGTPLVIRNTHEVRLTSAGEIFYEQSRSILDQVDRAIASAQNVAREKTSSATIGFVSGTEAPFLINIFSDIVERCNSLHISFRGQRERHLLDRSLQRRSGRSSARQAQSQTRSSSLRLLSASHCSQPFQLTTPWPNRTLSPFPNCLTCPLSHQTQNLPPIIMRPSSPLHAVKKSRSYQQERHVTAF